MGTGVHCRAQGLKQAQERLFPCQPSPARNFPVGGLDPVTSRKLPEHSARLLLFFAELSICHGERLTICSTEKANGLLRRIVK
jgi:hypothetical protein